MLFSPSKTILRTNLRILTLQWQERKKLLIWWWGWGFFVCLCGLSMYIIKCRCSRCWGEKKTHNFYDPVFLSPVYGDMIWVAGCISDNTRVRLMMCAYAVKWFFFFSLLLVKYSLGSNEKGDVWIHCCCSSFLGQVGLLLFPQRLYDC